MIPYRMNPLGITVNELLPLTFTALSAGSTVTLNANGSPTVSGLHYRLGKSGQWLSYTIGTTVTLANTGDSVQFWNSASTLSSSFSNFVQFALSGLIRADGSIQSMLAWTDSVPAYSFYMLFYQCSSLTQAPHLTAASVSSYGYQSMFHGCSRLTLTPMLPAVDVRNMCYSSMFQNCSSLVTASPIFAGRLYEYSFVSMFQNCPALVNPPELHITQLAPYCCNEMFYGCSSLADIPNLPDITLFIYCYYNMFRNCTSLTEAVLPSTALNTGSYRTMFRGCSSLASIEVAFGSWNSNAATEMWVEGVAASGTFIKPAALPEEYGVDRIPSGWTVVNK